MTMSHFSQQQHQSNNVVVREGNDNDPFARLLQLMLGHPNESKNNNHRFYWKTTTENVVA